MCRISPKATVPVLQLNNNTVIDESLDIMRWALKINDPNNIHLTNCKDYRQNDLILENDEVFKTHLDQYKYAERFPEHDQSYYRQLGEEFLKKLDDLLNESDYLMSDKLSVVDFAIFPFIRQFAFVNKDWFDQSAYPHLQKWLEGFLSSEIFSTVMYKYTPWKTEDTAITFPSTKNN